MPEPGPDASLRIALLNPCYWPEVRRGAERIVRELADGLIERGQQPTLITSHRGWQSHRVEDGLPVVRVPRPPQAALERMRFESYLTHAPLSYLALRRGSYELAHAMYPSDALAALRWRRRTGRPVVLTYMGIPARAWLGAARGRLELTRRAVAGCDAVVVLSEAAAAALRSSLGREARVIHPGVDLAAFAPRPSRRPEPTIVCTASPDIARKNVALLVEAFARVRARRPDARLVLVRPTRSPGAGTGPGFDGPGVEWVDQDHRPAVLAGLYGEAWVSALAAVDEAFGLALVESLACGTPVVGYAQGGIPEVLDRPGIGTLLRRLDAEELAHALELTLELAGDPLTAIRCRERAEDFSAERSSDRYLALYRELTGAACAS